MLQTFLFAFAGFKHRLLTEAVLDNFTVSFALGFKGGEHAVTEADDMLIISNHGQDKLGSRPISYRVHRS